MAIESPSAGSGRAILDIGPDLLNPNGVVHGAVLFAMVDTAMGAATMSVLEDGQACVPIEVHLRFLRAAAAGSLSGGRVGDQGGRRIGSSKVGSPAPTES